MCLLDFGKELKNGLYHKLLFSLIENDQLKQLMIDTLLAQMTLSTINWQLKRQLSIKRKCSKEGWCQNV